MVRAKELAVIGASTDNLQLEPWNDGFLLRRTQTNGHVTEIELSENNILTLAQSAQTLRDHILAKHSPAGAEGKPIVATPAPKVRLNFDPLHGEILLSLVEPSWPAPGSEYTELGVLMEPEVRHGAAEVYARVQA